MPHLILPAVFLLALSSTVSTSLAATHTHTAPVTTTVPNPL